MFKSIEFDDCVLAGIGNGTRDIDQWQLQLPLEIRSRVVAIVEAPNWHELPQGSRIEMPATPNSNAALSLPSLSLGILTIAAILCGIIFGFIFQSAAIVYLCLTVAGFSIGTTIFLQSRAKGVAAALGINPSIEDARSRADFIRLQMFMAETLRSVGMVLAIMLSVLLVWALYEVDKRYFGEVDSMVAASIRATTIFVFPITIWFAWYSYRKRSGAVFTVARCMRGLLASNLSPIWVSWLYAGKRYPAKVDAVQPTDRTLKQVAVDNWLLPVLFVICLVLFSNTQWLEGQFNVDPVPDNRRGKAHWVNYVVQWLFQHPTSTLFIAAPLGSLSIAGFAFKLLKVAIPKLAGRIAMAIFFLSLLLFATRSLA